MNLFALTVYNAGYHRLKDLEIANYGLVGQSSLFHVGDQFLCGCVLDIGQRRFPDVRRQPINRTFITVNGRWLNSSPLPPMEYMAILNRFDPPFGLLVESD